MATRSALDMMAEVAILNGVTADTIGARSGLGDFDWAAYAQHKAALCEDYATLQALLNQNTSRILESVLE